MNGNNWRFVRSEMKITVSNLRRDIFKKYHYNDNDLNRPTSYCHIQNQ